MKSWYGSLGVEFLSGIGIDTGHTVVDFGSRIGHYSIPAAIATGANGKVYAIDKDRSALEALKSKADGLGISNIESILTDGGVRIPLGDGVADCVLLYDILHMMEPHVRTELYCEALRVLRPGNMLSVHASHSKEFIPHRYFKDMELEDVRQEIEAAGFLYTVTIGGHISHDNGLVDSCVLNFRKR
jgi:ubiquinone/menaquinone biosynthesis C-methylase UbiE